MISGCLRRSRFDDERRKIKEASTASETLFNLEEDQLVKMVHHRPEEQQAATTVGNTPTHGRANTRLPIW